MRVIETTYIKGDTTIDTILLDLNCKIVYVYYKNGYARFFDSLHALLKYLNCEDMSSWFAMTEDRGDKVDSMLYALEKGLTFTT